MTLTLTPGFGASTVSETRRYSHVVHGWPSPWSCTGGVFTATRPRWRRQARKQRHLAWVPWRPCEGEHSRNPECLNVMKPYETGTAPYPKLYLTIHANSNPVSRMKSLSHPQSCTSRRPIVALIGWFPRLKLIHFSVRSKKGTCLGPF